VIIGDGACGKTSLLSVFTLGLFPTSYVPTVFENYVVDCCIERHSVQLSCWDTAGQGDYDRLRPLAYAKSNVVVIGFSVDSPESLGNVRHKWIPEARNFLPDAPVILVGLKADQRQDPLAVAVTRSFVSPEEGAGMARQCGARKYLECSSFTGKGVDAVLEAAIRLALLPPRPRTSSLQKCHVM
jgi:Rho family protein